MHSVHKYWYCPPHIPHQSFVLPHNYRVFTHPSVSLSVTHDTFIFTFYYSNESWLKHWSILCFEQLDSVQMSLQIASIPWSRYALQRFGPEILCAVHQVPCFSPLLFIPNTLSTHDFLTLYMPLLEIKCHTTLSNNLLKVGWHFSWPFSHRFQQEVCDLGVWSLWFEIVCLANLWLPRCHRPSRLQIHSGV